MVHCLGITGCVYFFGCVGINITPFELLRDYANSKHSAVTMLNFSCSTTSFYVTFIGLLVLACSIGTLAANAVTLTDDVSDRCVPRLHVGANGAPKHMGLRQQSNDAVVAGGFSVTAGAFAILLAVFLCCCVQSKAAAKMFPDPCLCAAVVGIIGAGLVAVGGIQLYRWNRPEERCGAPNRDGNYKMPDVEIAGTVLSGVLVLGLLTPVAQKYFSM